MKNNFGARELFLVIWPPATVIVFLLINVAGSVQLLTAARAYVGGEGLWSKAQKEAVV